jgi:hypothetical protein
VARRDLGRAEHRRAHFLGLARPLDYAQSAPVGFLWLERLAVVLGGVNELALRAVPFLAGVLLLVALWSLARRLLDVRYARCAWRSPRCRRSSSTTRTR